jgi:hypothetical protein
MGSAPTWFAWRAVIGSSSTFVRPQDYRPLGSKQWVRRSPGSGDRKLDQEGPLKQIRKRLTYANVMSSIAVFLVLGGAAVAATNLPANSVGTGQIKRNAVRAGKLAPEAVRAGRLAKNAIATNRLRDGVVTQPKLAASSVGAAQFKGIVVRAASVTIAKDSSVGASVLCQPGEKAIGVGTNWNVFEDHLYTNYARISGNGAEARGNNGSTESRIFTVEAYCWTP